LYGVIANADHPHAAAMLALPELGSRQIALQSRGSLDDESFGISYRFVDRDGRHDTGEVLGAVYLEGDGSARMLDESVWRLIEAVRGFARRTADQRHRAPHAEAWGRIRRLAIAAEANLDAFLQRTIVLTPERLAIGIEK